MGDPAFDIRNNPLSTEGMENLFEVVEPGSSMQNQSKEPGSEPTNILAVEVVSTDEAARRLGISTRAVIKRLKRGSLTGFRDDSKSRAEWRIYWNEPGSEPDGTKSLKGIITENAEQTSSLKGTQDPEEFGTGSSIYLVELNKNLLEQVQALTYQNGYLESQLTEREKDITERDEKLKLLTDSKHKQGWWHRFGAWFIGS